MHAFASREVTSDKKYRHFDRWRLLPLHAAEVGEVCSDFPHFYGFLQWLRSIIPTVMKEAFNALDSTNNRDNLRMRMQSKTVPEFRAQSAEHLPAKVFEEQYPWTFKQWLNRPLGVPENVVAFQVALACTFLGSGLS